MAARVQSRVNWLLISFILIGAFLRWFDLAPMSDTLYHDEAFNGVDAVSLLQQPRLTPFFDGNKGRESGWMYILAGFIGVFGAQPVAMRLAATMAGVLTLAALYALARELGNERTATWSVGALAVLFWHVHLSRIALRAILMPLLGALVFAFLWRAYRRGQRRDWIVGGVLLGVMSYTYLAARLWIGYAVVLLGVLAVFDARRRRGSLLAMLIAVVIALPLLTYLALNPVVAVDRVTEVARLDLTDLLNNVGIWLQAAFYRGSPIDLLNLANRPIFDPFLGTLFIIGLVALPRVIRWKWQMLWLLGLALTAVVPSIMTSDAPHPLRAIGLVLPIALLCGAGAWLIERGASRLKPGRWATLLPIGLLSVAGVITFQDAHVGWLSQPEVVQYMPYENELLQYLKANTSPETPVYLPFTTYLPVVDPGTDFRRAYLAPRPVSVFNPAECWVASTVSTLYVATSDEADGYRKGLERWSEPTLVISDVHKTRLLDTTFAVFRANPRSDFLADDPAATFVAGDQLQFQLVSALPATAPRGAQVPITWRITPLRDLDRPYSVFLHLYRKPIDFGAGPISQGDAPLCTSYPTNLWQPHERVLQDFPLSVPLEAEAGTYVVVAGVYDTETGARLPINSGGVTNEYAIIGQLDRK
jgi:hypothetical protein